MNATWTPTGGSAVQIAAGAPSEPVSGLSVKVARQVVTLAPSIGEALALPGGGQVVQIAFLVPRTAAAESVAQGERGQLIIQSPDGTAWARVDDAVIVNRTRGPLAGEVKTFQYTIQASGAVTNYTGTIVGHVLTDGFGRSLTDGWGRVLIVPL